MPWLFVIMCILLILRGPFHFYGLVQNMKDRGFLYDSCAYTSSYTSSIGIESDEIEPMNLVYRKDGGALGALFAPLFFVFRACKLVFVLSLVNILEQVEDMMRYYGSFKV